MSDLIFAHGMKARNGGGKNPATTVVCQISPQEAVTTTHGFVSPHQVLKRLVDANQARESTGTAASHLSPWEAFTCLSCMSERIQRSLSDDYAVRMF
jgi:hypothetical protein